MRRLLEGVAEEQRLPQAGLLLETEEVPGEEGTRRV